MAHIPSSILVIDIGSSETSAFLMDHVDNRYHVLAVGSAPSTPYAPIFDVWQGCLRAIRNLENLTGRVLLKADQTLITPANQRGEGVEKMVMTTSTGAQPKIMAAGLLEEVSLTSCRHLAASVGGQLVDQISLSERSSVERHLDLALKHRPEIILLAGGTEEGASRAVLKTADLIRSVCQLIPPGKRPVVVYAGNQKIAERVEKMLIDLTMVFPVANIRPSIEQENLAPAQYTLAEIMASIRTQQVAGLAQAAERSHLPLLPTAFTFGRTFRYLSLANPRSRLPVLGVDVGSDHTTVADALQGELRLNVLPYGVGYGIENTLNLLPLEEILRWIPADIPAAMVRDTLYQKTIFPDSLPIHEESLLIEQAFTRVLLQLALARTRKLFDRVGSSYELIAAAGKVISGAPSMQHSLMMLLDGIQPVGMSTVILDQNHLLAAIGAAAGIDPVVPVNALDNTMLPTLGTVVCPVSEEKTGKTILYGRLLYDSGEKVQFDVKKGEIKVLPLAVGETAQLELNTSYRTWLTPNRLAAVNQFRVVGGWCGLVFDGRGRPIDMPDEPQTRMETLRRWMREIGIPAQPAQVAQKLQSTESSGS
ncbi:MAG: glutamate mutase L [Anaerolineae bacterium]|nr:glutamate mutase L [Anaerolineae bacterium]